MSAVDAMGDGQQCVADRGQVNMIELTFPSIRFTTMHPIGYVVVFSSESP